MQGPINRYNLYVVINQQILTEKHFPVEILNVTFHIVCTRETRIDTYII